MLQHYGNKRIIALDGLMGIIPNSGVIPSLRELEVDNNDYYYVQSNNAIIKPLTHYSEQIIGFDDWTDDTLPEEDWTEITLKDGTVVRVPVAHNPYTGLPDYMEEKDLQYLMGLLDMTLQEDFTLHLTDYVIGNNNYFVFAAPKRLVVDKFGSLLPEFIMPDPYSDDVVAHCRDEHETPVYTDGTYHIYETSNTLRKLPSMTMEFMDSFYYTNAYGYVEEYCMWRSNGFFTRLFDDYGFEIIIKSAGPGSDSGIDDVIHASDLNKSNMFGMSSPRYARIVIDNSDITDDDDIMDDLDG